MTTITRRTFLKLVAGTAATLGLGPRPAPVAEAPETEPNTVLGGGLGADEPTFREIEAEPDTLLGLPIEMVDGDALKQDSIILGDLSAYTGWIPVDSFDRLYIMLAVGDMEPGTMVDCSILQLSANRPSKRWMIPGKRIVAQERTGDCDSLFTIEIDKSEVAQDCDGVIPEVHITGGFADVIGTAYIAKDG